MRRSTAAGSRTQVPAFVTHYTMRGRQPFLNLSDLDEARLASVLQDLAAARTNGLKRVFGPRYMELRRLTETRLRNLFIEAGGRPQRLTPHYFVLGSSRWFRGLYPDPEEVVLPLDSLPSDVTSVTYPDSFTAMGFGPRFRLPRVPRPYHERVFRVEELQDVVTEYGLPRDEPERNYDGYQNRPFEKYIEVQVWSDEPVAAFNRTRRIGRGTSG